MTDRIRQRIDILETQQREVTARRDAAQMALNETIPLLFHIEGALAVLRDLLVPEEVPANKVADG